MKTSVVLTLVAIVTMFVGSLWSIVYLGERVFSGVDHSILAIVAPGGVGVVAGLLLHGLSMVLLVRKSGL